MRVNMRYLCETVHYYSYFAPVAPNTNFVEAISKLYTCLNTNEGNFEELYADCVKEKETFVKLLKKNSKGQSWEHEMLEPLETFNLWFEKCMKNMCDVHNEKELGV